eukprot:m.39829 g.39829  ORF g.39829 m.39829 type:complete len:54 (+) comp9595_c0_seq2:157-318(+)
MGKLQDTAKKGDVQALHEILPVSGLGKQKIINDKDSSGMTAVSTSASTILNNI